MIDVDRLSNEIRRVDGSHSLGAGALAEALLPFIEQTQAARYVPIGFQWRARAAGNDLWSPWRDGPCPALAPKGTETEERRVYALASEPTE